MEAQLSDLVYLIRIQNPGVRIIGFTNFGERIIFSHIDQSLSPERAVFDSPGGSEAEPWVKKITFCQALKGRYKTSRYIMVRIFISPLQGLSFVVFLLPGAARCALTPGY